MTAHAEQEALRAQVCYARRTFCLLRQVMPSDCLSHLKIASICCVFVCFDVVKSGSNA